MSDDVSSLDIFSNSPLIDYDSGLARALSSPRSPFLGNYGGSGVLGESNIPWYQNAGLISGFAQGASALAALAGFKPQKKLLETQTEGIELNIANAKEEQARRNKNVSGFNSFKAGGPTTSAFTPKP